MSNIEPIPCIAIRAENHLFQAHDGLSELQDALRLRYGRCDKPPRDIQERLCKDINTMYDELKKIQSTLDHVLVTWCDDYRFLAPFTKPT